MKPRAFAAGIAQSSIYGHLSFHFGQCALMLNLGYRDGNDLDAAMVLGLYVQEMAVRWQQQRIEARLAARNYYANGVCDDAIGSASL